MWKKKTWLHSLVDSVKYSRLKYNYERDRGLSCEKFWRKIASNRMLSLLHDHLLRSKIEHDIATRIRRSMLTRHITRDSSQMCRTWFLANIQHQIHLYTNWLPDENLEIEKLGIRSNKYLIPSFFIHTSNTSPREISVNAKIVDRDSIWTAIVTIKWRGIKARRQIFISTIK